MRLCDKMTSCVTIIPFSTQFQQPTKCAPAENMYTHLKEVIGNFWGLGLKSQKFFKGMCEPVGLLSEKVGDSCYLTLGYTLLIKDADLRMLILLSVWIYFSCQSFRVHSNNI